MPDTTPSQQQTPSPQAPTPKVEAVIPPEGIFNVYTNHIGIAAGPNDVRVFLGELGAATPEKVQVAQRVAVVMSWIQAKATAALLQDYVNAYERLNGPIKLPKLPPQVTPTNPFAE
jgi:hypothetical protein